MSKSKSKKARRVLLVFGRGQPATVGQFLPAFFVNAGFEVRCALAADSGGWVATEALRSLSRSSVLADSAQPPGWATQPAPFDVTVCIGLSSAELIDIAHGSPAHPTLQLARRYGGTRFAALASEPEPETAQFLARHFAGLFPFPASIGEMQRASEALFARILSYLEAVNRFSHLRVTLQRQVPTALAHLAPEPPLWQMDFEQSLCQHGLQATFATPLADGATVPAALPDLAIELYGGPWPQSTGRKTSGLTFSFDPALAPAMPEARFQLRFMETQVPEKARDSLISPCSWLVCRLPGGDLLFQDRHGSRVLPDLLERPALQRLAELLAERLTATP